MTTLPTNTGICIDSRIRVKVRNVVTDNLFGTRENAQLALNIAFFLVS